MPKDSIREHDVLIVGAGPTGMMLAAELAIAGIDVAIIERRTNQDVIGSRAGGLHARTIEVLDMRGVAERFLSQGKTFPVVHFHVPLDISDFPSRHPYVLGLRQRHIERILAEWVAELPVVWYRDREVTTFAQDESGVTVSLASGETLRARYLVGCDGGRSIVRKTAGIDFPGWDASTSWLIAEAEMTETPPYGFKQDAVGIHAIGPSDTGGVGVVLTERTVSATSEPTIDDIREALVSVYGTDFGIHSATWISRFTDMARQAAAYRNGRVLLAGDAAHIHAPVGGQGLNVGVQDAVNLGWKLAQVMRGTSNDSLLDSYHAERHPVAARAIRNTLASVTLRRTDERTRALGEYVATFLSSDEPRKRMAGEMSGLDIRYDFGEGHPLVGRRMPDLDVVVDGRPTRVFELMHEARPLLLHFGGKVIDVARWVDRVRLIRATYDGAWELPVIGKVASPAAVLVRPDGHVGWVGDGTTAGLVESLERWFGTAA